MKTNVIERLGELLAMLEEAQDSVTNSRMEAGDSDPNLRTASAAIENAAGVAGEILTMIDGR